MKLILLLYFATALQLSFSQQERSSFSIGQIVEFDSGILAEKRKLNIYLPEYYYQDTCRYEVVYLLDGSENEDFLHVVGLVQFLCMYELLPKTIVVGIANVDRKRDFTYPTTIEQDKIDFPTTYANVVASSKLEGGKIPIPMADGDKAVRLALKTLNGIDPVNARVVRIKNTLKLAEIYVSEAMLDDVNKNSMLEVISSAAEMSFNSSQF